jgi:diguanylate cyclase (GGDEF)-like protein
MGSIRLLLVEDSHVVKRVVDTALNESPESDYHITCVETLSRAREELSGACPYDAALLDLGLPDSDGIDTLRAVVRLCPHLPVVVLTASDENETAVQALREGAQDFLSKKYASDGVLLCRTLRHAIERQGLLQKIHYQARHDELTGALNRRYLLDQLSYQRSCARRYGRPLAFCLCDLDHFKQVNDREGHLAGDAVLRRFAELLLSHLRQTDLVGRYGGDEFGIILPHSRATDAGAVLERLRAAVEAEVFPGSENRPLALTSSFGLAELTSAHARDDDLIEAADEALYRAKEAGRNRWSL